MNLTTLYQSEGKVWKLLIDDVRDILLIEARNEDEREVTFSAVDLTQEQPLWTDYLLEEPWWLTMQYAKNGVLLITEFEDDQNPISKQVIAIDAEEGEGLWQLEGIFETANTSSVVMQTVDEALCLVDLTEGNITALTAKEASQFQSANISTFLTPQHYLEKTPYFETVASFLVNKIDDIPVLAIDYCETKEHIIITYYQQIEIHYQQILAVFSRDGEQLFTTILGKELTGIGNEPFLIYKNHLLYIKDKKKVQYLNLHRLYQ